MFRAARIAFGCFLIVITLAPAAFANPAQWKFEWPNTDFTKHSVEYGEILSGGPPKDGIPAIDDPVFEDLSDVTHIPGTEPVIGVSINGEMRAYPLHILMWHEIVNDVVGDTPITVTFCPLCNTAVVFDRRVAGKVLDFGTTGKLRNSDLVMYDRQTETWWQQFLGEAIIGELMGTVLKVVPARLESFAKFKARADASAKVLVPNSKFRRAYGANPYVGYDSRKRPYPFFRGEMPSEVAPLSRVININGEAWALDLLRKRTRVEIKDGIIITWEPGQNSALDAGQISRGVDVGNVVVQKPNGNGVLEDIPYRVDFAFAFRAFYPDAPIHVE